MPVDSSLSSTGPTWEGSEQKNRISHWIGLGAGRDVLGRSSLGAGEEFGAQSLLRRDPHPYGWSFDAYIFGNTKAGPEDAYRYAIGEPIDHPAGYKVKITRPLDFMAVTDHAEYAGVVPLANDPNSPISKLPIAEKLKVRSKDDIQRVYLFLGDSLMKNEPIKELVSPEIAGNVWQRIIGVADKYYQPGKFTTFVAYEWTSTPDNRNLHRNIIFKDSKKVPEVPFFFPRLGPS